MTGHLLSRNDQGKRAAASAIARARRSTRERTRVPKVAGRLWRAPRGLVRAAGGATSGPGSLDRLLGRGARIRTLRRWTGSTGRPSRGSRATPRGSSSSRGRKTRACRRIRRSRTHHRHKARAPAPSSALARGLVLPDPDSWHPLRRFVGLTPRALNPSAGASPPRRDARVTTTPITLSARALTSSPEAASASRARAPQRRRASRSALRPPPPSATAGNARLVRRNKRRSRPDARVDSPNEIPWTLARLTPPIAAAPHRPPA